MISYFTFAMAMPLALALMVMGSCTYEAKVVAVLYLLLGGSYVTLGFDMPIARVIGPPALRSASHFLAFLSSCMVASRTLAWSFLALRENGFPRTSAASMIFTFDFFLSIFGTLYGFTLCMFMDLIRDRLGVSGSKRS